jgi:hypothetical protein
MYAPSSLNVGSSVSHIDTAASPNELMEPIQTGPKASLGLSTYILEDIGWSTQSSNAPIISDINDSTIKNSLTSYVSFAILDNDSDVNTITTSATSSNASVIPNSSITSSGSGRLRTLEITPTQSATGVVTLTVIADDGTNVTQTNFDLTVINDSPPTVTILSPADGSIFYSAPQVFSASASDAEDGDISASTIWSSSITGGLGSGSSISPSLSDGNHTITAQVSDSGTNSDSAFITITVDLAGDADSDGLSNNQEVLLGSNPNLADSDSDGVSDFNEVNRDGDPSNYTVGIDTDPNNSDTDGDGVPDNTDPDPNDPNVTGYNIPTLPLVFLVVLFGLMTTFHLRVGQGR